MNRTANIKYYDIQYAAESIFLIWVSKSPLKFRFKFYFLLVQVGI